MSIKSKFKNGLYTSLIVGASLFGTTEVKGQQPISNRERGPADFPVNFFQSQDTTENAKAYNKLTTKAQRDSTIDARVGPDWVDIIPGDLNAWNCNQYMLQLVVNSHDWGDKVYYDERPMYNNHYGSETDIQQLYQSGGTLKDMGKLGLPTYGLSLSDKITLKDGHAMNIILTGDDATKFENWTIIEPQNDQINIKPGDGRSPFPKDCEHVQIYYNYLYKTSEHEKNYFAWLMLEFKVTDGIAELIYNVNKDTTQVPWYDWKPLNELVHLIEKRSDIGTATKPERKLENELKVYPNPTRNYINIETRVNEPSTINIELYDMTGRLIENHTTKEYGTFKEQLDISKVAPGMYMLNIETKNNNGKTYRETTKIIKQ